MGADNIWPLKRIFLNSQNLIWKIERSDPRQKADDLLADGKQNPVHHPIRLRHQYTSGRVG